LADCLYHNTSERFLSPAKSNSPAKGKAAAIGRKAAVGKKAGVDKKAEVGRKAAIGRKAPVGRRVQQAVEQVVEAPIVPPIETRSGRNVVRTRAFEAGTNNRT
jgi:UDP-3-O-[3-hydroxymyristoyl] glucosamine N-acyltransferase